MTTQTGTDLTQGVRESFVSNPMILRYDLYPEDNWWRYHIVDNGISIIAAPTPFDKNLGTFLQSQGQSHVVCPELLSFLQPRDIVRSAHCAYLLLTHLSPDVLSVIKMAYGVIGIRFASRLVVMSTASTSRGT